MCRSLGHALERIAGVGRPANQEYGGKQQQQREWQISKNAEAQGNVADGRLIGVECCQVAKAVARSKD
jgi:hypothetical protein